MLLCRQPDLMMTVKREAPYAIRATSFDQGASLWRDPPANALYLDAAFQLLASRVMPSSSTNYDRARLMASAYRRQSRLRADVGPGDEPALLSLHPPICRARCWTRPPTNRSIPSTSPCKGSARRGAQFVSRTQRAVGRYGTQPLTLLRAVLLNPLIQSAISAICWRISSGWAPRSQRQLFG
jgi:glutamate decarboxylase